MQVASIEFGKFHLLEEVRRGPISTVHRAVLRGLKGFERQVAIKCMLPELARQPHFVQAFIDQAKLLALLDHNNIVKIYDFGRVDDRYFIAMEYVEDSESLETHGGRKMLPTEAAHLVEQVCSGLHYAHERGLVHGDLNPSNVLLRDHSIKLIDFGIAQLERVALADQPPKRKWGYLSPEQVEGSPPTPWSDIFSAGAILWELLTGEPLFEGFAPHLTLGNILKAAVPPIAEYQPELEHAERFDAICSRALARHSSDRYHDAAAMADDLIAVLESSRAGLCLLYGGGTLASAAMPLRQIQTVTDRRDSEDELVKSAPASSVEPEHHPKAGTGPHPVGVSEKHTGSRSPRQDTGPHPRGVQERRARSSERRYAREVDTVRPLQQEATAAETLSSEPDELDAARTEVRKPKLEKGQRAPGQQDPQVAAEQKAADERRERSERSGTGPQLPAGEEQSRRWREDSISPARARAMSSLMRTIAERNRLHTERASRHRSMIFVLCGMLLVSLTTNVVLLLRTENTSAPMEPSRPITVVANAPEANVPEANVPKAEGKQDVIAMPDVGVTVTASRDSSAAVAAGDTGSQAGAASPTSAPSGDAPAVGASMPARRGGDDLISATKEAIRVAGLERQLQQLLKRCDLAGSDGLQIGLHIGSAGKVRRVFIGQDAAQADCARNKLLKAQLNIVLRRQMYMEWQFSKAGMSLLRLQPSK